MGNPSSKNVWLEDIYEDEDQPRKSQISRPNKQTQEIPASQTSKLSQEQDIIPLVNALLKTVIIQSKVQRQLQLAKHEYREEAKVLFKVSPKVEEVEKKLQKLNYPKQFNDNILVTQDTKTYKINGTADYTGQWTNIKTRHGTGVQILEDGSKYEGQWRHDFQNGYGRFINYNGDYYEGEWRDGKANGNGQLHTYDGIIYKGQFKDDLKEDNKGVETYPDGSKYEGSFQKGLKVGKGKFAWSNKSQYEGDFSNNMMEGKGTFEWNDGRRYDGKWKNNKMEGIGVYTWKDGRKYMGDYKQDQKDGEGTYTWADGKSFNFRKKIIQRSVVQRKNAWKRNYY